MRSIAGPTRALIVTLALAALSGGCISSEVRRITIDVDPVAAWAGQGDRFATPDSLVASVVPITARLPEIVRGEVSGVEEIALFIQLQNADVKPVEAAVYAHRSRVARDALLEGGIPLTSAILIHPQSALQIDARNYRLFARAFDALVELIFGGDFYLYVVSEDASFILNGNVPSLSFLVAIDD